MPEWISLVSYFVVTSIVVPAVVAFFSARFGAAESRRQFEILKQKQTLAACGELFRIFLEFGSRCENYICSNRNYFSSQGQMGQPITSFAELKLPEDIIQRASDVDVEALSKVLLFMATTANAEESVAFSRNNVSEEDAAIDLEHWAALLTLRAYEIANHARTVASINWEFSLGLAKRNWSDWRLCAEAPGTIARLKIGRTGSTP